MMENTLTPFSLGRHACIGQNLAWAELYIAVSQIVRNVRLSFSSELMEDSDMEMEDRFYIAPKGKRLLLHVSPLLPS
jgi:cytochrome P450